MKSLYFRKIKSKIFDWLKNFCPSFCQFRRLVTDDFVQMANALVVRLKKGQREDRLLYLEMPWATFVEDVCLRFVYFELLKHFKTLNNFKPIFSDDYFQITLFQWRERNDCCQLQVARASVLKPVISIIRAFMKTREQLMSTEREFQRRFQRCFGTETKFV